MFQSTRLDEMDQTTAPEFLRRIGRNIKAERARRDWTQEQTGPGRQRESQARVPILEEQGVARTANDSVEDKAVHAWNLPTSSGRASSSSQGLTVGQPLRALRIITLVRLSGE